MDLLKFLLTNMSVTYGNYKTEISNGVPQGSTLSPHLFNIAISDLMLLMDKMEQLDYRLYADDLVIWGKLDNIRKCLSSIRQWNS